MAVASVGAAAGAARGQCGPEWQPLGAARGMDGEIRALTTWDPDGPGPQAALVVAGGEFTIAGGVQASRVARWDGEAWRPLGAGLNGTVRALTTWDFDGPGPAPARLVAGGEFAGPMQIRGVAWWDGARWQALGSPVVWPYALTSWDPDGDGPEGEQLVAAGRVGVQRWDGSTWRWIGANPGGQVYAATTWDPDGEGPAGRELVVGGNGIWRWDGGAWVDFQEGLSFGRVRSLTSWDADGAGPEGERLFAGCDYSFSEWNGSLWVNREPSRAVLAFTTYDIDGKGPGEPELVLGGAFSRAGTLPLSAVARWDGAEFEAFPEQFPSSTSIGAFTVWDPDGVGPIGPTLVAAGSFQTARVGRTFEVLRWEGGGWHEFERNTNATVTAVSTFDPDGHGPAPDELVLGGPFTTIGGVAAEGVARWDGRSWHAMGEGLSGGSSLEVRAFTRWDPDGSGPATTLLVAGGRFTASGEEGVPNLGAWDGERWTALGGGTASRVNALTTWDPDGDGPEHAWVVVGGGVANNIGAWDGAAWRDLGGGMDGLVLALTTWDPDGDGPEATQLVAGGEFTTAGGAATSRIARWDGSMWHALGSGVDGDYPQVTSLTTWDPDGDGPEPAVLVAGGNFTEAGGTPARRIARWDGMQWAGFGDGLSNDVYSVTVWRGGDQEVPELVAGGRVTGAVARWDGARWLASTGGPNGAVDALTTWDADGDGPRAEQIVAAGPFSRVGLRGTGYVALYGCKACPCDWNNSGSLESQDLFDFLTRFFSGTDADFNRDFRVTPLDLLEFLECFNNPPDGC